MKVSHVSNASGQSSDVLNYLGLETQDQDGKGESKTETVAVKIIALRLSQ